MSNERGIAMPMALIVMVILTALMAAFAVLATSEPQIASNQVASAQARALAESGVERVLWALTTGETTPTANGVITMDAGYNLLVVPAAYDGTTENTLGVGSFKVSVANGVQPNIKIVTAVGFVPNATTPIAVKKITTQVTRLKWMDPSCGLCGGGEEPPGLLTTIKVGGTAGVNATQSAQGTIPAGNYCAGVPPPTSAIGSTGSVEPIGSPDLYAPPGGVQMQNSATFPSTQILSDSDIATLKAMAKMKGLYVKGTPTWNFPPQDGLIFVDTADGSVLTATTPPANIPTVSINGNGTWGGWLIVAGNVHISGNINMTGLIYAQNDVTLNGTGNGGFRGAVVSTNRVDVTSTNIDAVTVGNAPIMYDCPAVRNGGGQMSQNWFIMPGTFREVSGQ